MIFKVSSTEMADFPWKRPISIQSLTEIITLPKHESENQPETTNLSGYSVELAYKMNPSLRFLP